MQYMNDLEVHSGLKVIGNIVILCAIYRDIGPLMTYSNNVSVLHHYQDVITLWYM